MEDFPHTFRLQHAHYLAGRARSQNYVLFPPRGGDSVFAPEKVHLRLIIVNRGITLNVVTKHLHVRLRP